MRMFDDFFSKALDQIDGGTAEIGFDAEFQQCAVSYGLLVVGHENADGLKAETARKALPKMIGAIRAHAVKIQQSALPQSKERYELDRLRTVQEGFRRRLEQLTDEKT